ncbi:MAG: BamA/TamA family outer membrane protein, partial [Bacteroidia bacterium]|nr:BamA/TamA family outer membrane protein [Bacteroidia bacterium]
LMRLLSKKALPFLKGFRYSIPDIIGLTVVSKDFDRVFLTGLDANEWDSTIKEVQKKLTDSVITNAIRKMPEEIFAVDGKVLTKKLISRRALLENAGMKYYRFLSRKVNIVGSNEKEYFKINSNPQGLNVRVYSREKNDTSFLMYNRTFDHRDTKEIRLYALNGNDLFDIDENVSSRIKLRVIGGRGNDTFDMRGNVRNFLYDLDVEGNYIKNQSHSRNMFSTEPTVNDHDILGFQYNEKHFPSISMAVNNDDGLLVGAGISRKIYGFRNDPFVSYQRASVLWAINRGAQQFKYSGVFNHAIKNTDIIVASELMTPGINNFFGLGNKTQIDPDKPITYYRARFRHMETQLLFQKRMGETLRIMAGPVIYSYWNKPEENFSKVLGAPSQIGLDSLSIYSKKKYIGGKFVININNLNNELFPTRGIQWTTDFTSMAGITKSSNNITKFQSDMAVYASLNDPTRLIAVIRLGGGRIYSKNFEYFQALTLGSNNYLRGFRKNRFAGRSILYGGLELRLKLLDVTSYILPGSFGLIGFNETGKVWLKNETSHIWHYSYGGGLYYIPFNLFLVSATVGFSKEEHIVNFSVGTKINLNF